MNLLQAYQFLNMINEGMEDYQENYKNYVLEHKKRVEQFASWLKENLPEIFEGVDMDAFNDVIREHDDSKFSEEEFEPYAKHFYDEDDYSLEFDDAWEHHWMNNEHHPEHWLGQDMPYIYILEMLCDWGSFSIAKRNFRELINYYYEDARDDDEKNLSSKTKKIIEDILRKISAVIEKGSY